MADLPELPTRIDSALARAGRIARGDEGLLCVGFIENANFHLVPDVITRLRRRFPNAQIELVEMISPDIPDTLARGDIDLALTRPLPTDTLRAHEVMRERFYVALSDGDPLVRQDTVPARALFEMTFSAAAGRKSSFLRGQFGALFERQGFRLGIGQEVNQLPAIIALVAAGGGFTILPRSATGLSILGVCYRPFRDEDAPEAVLHACSREHETNPLVQAFFAFALELRSRG